MTVFRLISLPIFPAREDFDEGGIIAFGGDLSPRRILAAYRAGIFPWDSYEGHILWWSPDPRLILHSNAVKLSRSLKKSIRRGHFEVRMDTAFREVLKGCASPRDEEGGTWLTPEMQQSYHRLHQQGYGHSVETWMNGELVGGLYGLCIGTMFFGESMFARVPDASKVALLALGKYAQLKGIPVIDCQTTTPHLVSMGAVEVPRQQFFEHLDRAMSAPTDHSRWDWPGGLELLLEGPTAPGPASQDEEGS